MIGNRTSYDQKSFRQKSDISIGKDIHATTHPNQYRVIRTIIWRNIKMYKWKTWFLHQRMVYQCLIKSPLWSLVESEKSPKWQFFDIGLYWSVFGLWSGDIFPSGKALFLWEREIPPWEGSIPLGETHPSLGERHSPLGRLYPSGRSLFSEKKNWRVSAHENYNSDKNFYMVEINKDFIINFLKKTPFRYSIDDWYIVNFLYYCFILISPFLLKQDQTHPP